MSDSEQVENARASSEARQAAPRARAGHGTEAVDAALKRYLATEHYLAGHEGEERRDVKPLAERTPERTYASRIHDALREPRKPVVVCVDGTDDGDRALRYAIERARALHAGIRLVHIISSSEPLPSGPYLDDVGDRVLEDAVARCTELAPEVVVTVSPRRGDKHRGFVEESGTAECLVLGSRRESGFGPWSSTNLASVAAQCPVITVPLAWQQDKSSGPVVVAVSDPVETVELVGPALRESRLRGARLVVLHAWRPPDPYAHAIPVDGDDVDWAEATERELRKDIAGIRADFPDVPVAIQVLRQAPEVALKEACEDACLLVLGHHHSFLPMFSGVGRVPYVALHAGACPVEIVWTSMTRAGQTALSE